MGKSRTSPLSKTLSKIGASGGLVTPNKNNSVENVINYKFGDVPLSSNASEYLSFGEKNIKNVWNENAKQYGGLSRDRYNSEYQNYQNAKNKGGIMSPKEVQDSMKFTKVMIENEQYNLKVSTNDVSKKAISSMIVGMVNSYNMLNDWFDTKKTNPKYFNKQWKAYYQNHPEKFR